MKDADTVFALFLSGNRMRTDLPKATEVILALVRYVEYGSTTKMINSETRGWLQWTGATWAPAGAGILLREVLPQFAEWLTTSAIHDFLLHTYDRLVDEADTRDDFNIIDQPDDDIAPIPTGAVLFQIPEDHQDALTLEDVTPMQAGGSPVVLRTCVPTAEGVSRMADVIRHVVAECFSTTSKLNATLTLVGKAAAKDHVFDNIPGLINTPGGVVDLCTGDLRTHCPDDRHARVAQVTPDPTVEIPVWDSLVARNIEPDAQDYFQMMCGYLLSGWTYLEHFYVIQGVANTGKSTMITALRDILGSYAETAGTSILDRSKSIRDDLARLCGARMAHVNELALKTGVCLGHIKTMTTRNSQLAAEFKYGNQFTFTSSFKLVIDTNDLPSMEDPSDGIWRRLVIFRFNKAVGPEEIDVSLDEKLRREYPGILSWCIAGAARLHELYQSGTPIHVPASCRIAHAGGCDATIKQYVEDRLVLAANGASTTQDVYQDYVHWCEDEGIVPTGARELVRSLTDQYNLPRTRIRDASNTRVRGIAGVVLATRPKRR